MFCAQCGSKLTDGVKFCTACGAPISSREPLMQPSNGASQMVRSAPMQPSVQSVPAMAGPVPPTGSAQYASPTWQPATTPELGGDAREIKTNRGLFKYIIFSVLTLGIYSFYFIYKMAQDMNTMCEDDDQKTGGLVAFILLSILTLGFYGVYWWYKIANRVYLNAPRYGFNVAEKGSTFLLWYLVGFLTFGLASLVGYHAVIQNVNSLAKAYNRTHGYA